MGKMWYTELQKESDTFKWIKDLGKKHLSFLGLVNDHLAEVLTALLVVATLSRFFTIKPESLCC